VSGFAPLGARRLLAVGALALLAPGAAAQDAVALPDGLRAALEREIRASRDAEVCIPYSFPTAVPWLGHPAYGSGPLAFGVPPFENRYAPGQYGVAIASEGGADAYLRMRAQMDFLSKIGFFDAEPFTYVYPATGPLHYSFQTMGARNESGERDIPVETLRRPQPAIRYTLTAKGWLATLGKPCFPLGRRGLARVLSVKLTESNGLEIAHVEYETGLQSPSQDYARDDLARGFGAQVLRTGGTRRMRTSFVKSAEGWVSQQRVQALLRGGASRPAGPADAPEPKLQTVQAALDAYLLAHPSLAQACHPLPAGADVSDNIARLRAGPDAGWGADFYDFPDMSPERGVLFARGLALARDLAAAGALSAEPATPLLASGQPDALGGARYTPRPELLRYVNRAQGPACLGYAELRVEVGGFEVKRSDYAPPQLEFVALARPAHLYQWAEPASARKALPVVLLAERRGVGFKGRAALAADGWRVQRLEVLAPVYDKPFDWKDLLASLPRAAEYRKWNAAQTSPEAQAVVVRSAGSASVSVKGTGRPLILHLSSALPVEWRLKVARGAKLVRVVASTPTTVRVRGVPAKVPLQICDAATTGGREDSGGTVWGAIRPRAAPPPQPGDCPPPLRPPPERFYGSGTYVEAMLNAGGYGSNLVQVESALGAEFTVIQTEVHGKRFTIPRRYVAPGAASRR
jgi:hypothetical protein